MSTKLEQAGKRLTKGAEKIIRECDDVLRDMHYWNATHPNQKPVTADDMPRLIEQKRWAQQVIRAVRNGEPIPAEV